LPPLAGDLLDQRLDFDLEGRAGQGAARIAECRARGFAEVVQGAVE
jgi:hypothetical protein